MGFHQVNPAVAFLMDILIAITYTVALFLRSSEPNVPDVILVCKSCLLGGSRGTADDSPQPPNDGFRGNL